jgi:hypothetical protein
MYFILKSPLALLLAGAALAMSAQAAPIDVYTTGNNRDPSVFQYGTAYYVIGTDHTAVEFPNSSLTPSQGANALIHLYDKNGTLLTDQSCWDKNVHNIFGGYYMYCGRNSQVYAFKPKVGGCNPLPSGACWQLVRAGAVTTTSGYGAYSHHIVTDAGTTYLFTEEFDLANVQPTCEVSFKMTGPATLDTTTKKYHLCPGVRLGSSSSRSNWGSTPYAEEARSGGPGIVEGAHLYKNSSNGYWYMFYSDGHYASSCNYGGMVARSLGGGLRDVYIKLLTADKSNILPILPGCGDGKTARGRPFPFDSSGDGNIDYFIFHARGSDGYDDYQKLPYTNSDLNALTFE